MDRTKWTHFVKYVMDTNGTKFMAQNRGLIYKRLHDKYTTML